MPSSKPKRLLIVIWNMGIGGVQKRVRDMILDIDKNHPDWEVHLLIKFKNPSYFIDQIQTKTKTKIYYFSQSHKKSNRLPSVFWIAKQYLKIKPQVGLTFLEHLSVNLVSLKIVFFWVKTRIVLNEATLTSTYLNIRRNHSFLWRFLIIIFYRFADLIIVPTKAVKEDLVRNFYLPKKLIKIVPNWTLFPNYYPLAIKYDLIFVGRFAKEKNLTQLLKLVKKLKQLNPKIRLAMVGEGKEEKNLKTLADRLGISNNIVWIPFQKDVSHYLRRSKLLLLTTLNEGLPNVILEAAACGLPTITSHFPGSEAVIKQGQTGWITANQKQLFDKTKKLLNDNALRILMGQKAQRFVNKKFSYPNQRRFIQLLLTADKHNL